MAQRPIQSLYRVEPTTVKLAASNEIHPDWVVNPPRQILEPVKKNTVKGQQACDQLDGDTKSLSGGVFLCFRRTSALGFVLVLCASCFGREINESFSQSKRLSISIGIGCSNPCLNRHWRRQEIENRKLPLLAEEAH
ncbi:hypothetical protein PIB30_071143 [Stylosanthes scabra]|uniref:Uncharacterized protein n=1 Tax=Stylosanthes scabra TaxID=79078 RepID=A0ABU6SP88_9FABA|nr:hypothetical protein [Stylosanthes scabra]